jgi:hypothetical protein
MADRLDVTVEELVASLKRQKARIPFEIGAFVALQVCEQLLERPTAVGPADVRISEEGTVEIEPRGGPETARQAPRSVTNVLAHVLVAAGQGVPQVLIDLVERGTDDGGWELPRLRDELEASLVPLNRGAARRVLSRLVREARREGQSQSPADDDLELSEGDVDAELDALLEGSQLPEPHGGTGAAAAEQGAPGASARASAFGRPEAAVAQSPAPDSEPPTAQGGAGRMRKVRASGVGAGAPSGAAGSPAGASSGGPPEPASPRQPSAPAEPPPAETDYAPPVPQPMPAEQRSSKRPTAAGAVRTPNSEPKGATDEQAGPRLPDVDAFEEAADRPGLGWLWAAIFFVLALGLVGAVYLVRPDVFTRLAGGKPEAAVEAEKKRQAEREAKRQEMLAEHRASYGDLVVEAKPAKAQVLLFVGRGPTEAEKLPLGVAHEFVAIADGKTPTRAVVPKDAQWSSDEEPPRYELAMQTGDEPMEFESLTLGDSKLPQNPGKPSGKRGTVRIVTNPPGAKVYLLIGFSPKATVRDIAADEAHELLIVRDGYEPKRVVVGPSDWRKTNEGGRRATIEVALDK